MGALGVVKLIPHNWLHDSRRPTCDWRVLETVAGLVSEDGIATSSANVQKSVKGWTGTNDATLRDAGHNWQMG
jgi:hypothetical protein